MTNDNSFPGMYMNSTSELEALMTEQIDTASQAANEAQGDVHERIVIAMKNLYDPEIPVNIYDLGLIYEIKLDDTNDVEIDMTLTTPGCPVAQYFPSTVENVVRKVNGVKDVHVNLVWDPPWSKDRMTQAALLQLGLL